MSEEFNTGQGRSLRSSLLALPRRYKQGLVLAADCCGVVLALVIASVITGLSLSQDVLVLTGPVGWWLVVVSAISVAIPVNAYFGLYRSVVRFMGARLFVAALKSSAVAAIVLYLAGLSIAQTAPLSRFLGAYFALLLIITCSLRFMARMYLNRRDNHTRERVMIYGAGAAGVRLAEALEQGDNYLPIGFVDDSRQLWGQVVGGLDVYQSRRLKDLIESMNVGIVLLALPSISRRRRRKILERLVEMPVHVQTVPEISDIVSGSARVSDVRDVEVEDLLGRVEVPPNPELLEDCVKAKVVLVTGAGGSIGSELCRQILALQPKILLLFEISEVALYQIDRQLHQIAIGSKLDVNVVPLLGSVHHKDRIRQIMAVYGVQTVYHAAAYKHVPMVEQNIVDGVHNNAFGTLHTARAALETGVETFVLISTDKAVSPTNVMGATKRFAELVLQALQHENENIRFCMVRFGNVLASSGSVVPLFKEQIQNGGPVTVTHPEIIRYFMTIPEAAQLVIQAGSMAKGGDVFVLDMGNPVKIVDLARRMISLMGLSVRDDTHKDGDIEIEFTGLRPAEKLYEELLIGTDVAGTEHPRILRANETFLLPEHLDPLIDELWAACRSLDTRLARDVLLRAVAEYKPSNPIEDLVWSRRQALEAADNVTTLAAYRDPS